MVTHVTCVGVYDVHRVHSGVASCGVDSGAADVVDVDGADV